MRVSASGAVSVKGLQGPETMLGAGSLEARTTLTSLRLGELQLAIECMDFCRDVEDASIRFMIAGNLGRETPIVGATSQVHGLVIRGGFAPDGVDEPHGEWLGGGVANVRGGGV